MLATLNGPCYLKISIQYRSKVSSHSLTVFLREENCSINIYITSGKCLIPCSSYKSKMLEFNFTNTKHSSAWI